MNGNYRYPFSYGWFGGTATPSFSGNQATTANLMDILAQISNLNQPVSPPNITLPEAPTQGQGVMAAIADALTAFGGGQPRYAAQLRGRQQEREQLQRQMELLKWQQGQEQQRWTRDIALREYERQTPTYAQKQQAEQFKKTHKRLEQAEQARSDIAWFNAHTGRMRAKDAQKKIGLYEKYNSPEYVALLRKLQTKAEISGEMEGLIEAGIDKEQAINYITSRISRSVDPTSLWRWAETKRITLGNQLSTWITQRDKFVVGRKPEEKKKIDEKIAAIEKDIAYYDTLLDSLAVQSGMPQRTETTLTDIEKTATTEDLQNADWWRRNYGLD